MANKPTPGGQWGKQTELVELPSGNAAELRKAIDTQSLIRKGVFTNELIEIANQAFEGELEDLELAVQLQDIFVSAMFVNPTVVGTQDEKDAANAKAEAILASDPNAAPLTAITLDDVGEEDLTFIAQRAFTSMAGADATFRDESAGIGAGDDSEDVVHNTEPLPGLGSDVSSGLPVGPFTSQSTVGSGGGS